MYHGYFEEETRCCANCRHYHQHYVYSEQAKGFTHCNDGHCVYPRMKHRQPHELCEHFEKGEKDSVQIARWADV